MDKDALQEHIDALADRYAEEWCGEGYTETKPDPFREDLRILVEAEREACAKIAEELQPLVNDDGESVAARIRARAKV